MNIHILRKIIEFYPKFQCADKNMCRSPKVKALYIF